MKKCREIQAELSAYIDNELPSTERATVEEHVQGCRVCQERLAELKQLMIGVMALPQLQPVPGFLADVRRRIAWDAKSQPKTWQDYLLRPLWLKVPLEAVAAIAIVLLVIRLQRPAIESVPVNDRSTASGANPASTKKMAGGEARSTDKLAPNRPVGRAAPMNREPAADLVTVYAKDFDGVQNRVQQLAVSMNGRIMPAPPGQPPTNVFFVELPPENVAGFKSQLQTAKPLNTAPQPSPANEPNSVADAVGQLERETAPIVLQIQILPPAD